MKKLTPQVLALYLGQKCETPHGIGELKIASANGECSFKLANYHNWIDCHTSEIKPILRPLSSLTESEARDLYEIKFGFKYDGENCTEEYWQDFDSGLDTMLSYSVGNTKIWLKLFYWGFDLFSLIDNGLAIDATKMEVEKTV